MEDQREQPESTRSKRKERSKGRGEESSGTGVASFAQEARTIAEQQKAAGADRVARLGHAIHGAADEIGRELPQAAHYIHSAAQSLESVSSALRERSIGELASELKNLTKQQPATAFVGWVAAGFAISRFLKSSSSSSASSSSMTDDPSSMTSPLP
jgi:hypothetical protein